MIRRPVVAVALTGTAGLALAGCGSTPHRDAVTGAARSFVAKLSAGDGVGACRMLTEDARSSATGATDVSCAQAVKNVKEQGTAISGVQVWGDAAQVHVGRDVVFLRLVDGRWRISAAGCTPRKSGPYDCDVGG